MSNPYQSTGNESNLGPQRKWVRRYIVLAMLMAMMAGCIAIPGFRILIQELGWFPTMTFVTGIEINGHPFSNATFIRFSLGIALIILLVSILLFALAKRNFIRNKRLAIPGKET